MAVVTSHGLQVNVAESLQYSIKETPSSVGNGLTCYKHTAIHVCLTPSEKQAAWAFTLDLLAHHSKELVPVVAYMEQGQWRFICPGYFARGELIPMSEAGAMEPEDAALWEWTHDVGLRVFAQCFKEHTEAEDSLWRFVEGGGEQ